ncbi:hypothetical protein C9925_00260 [cyanobacterium G8-9]|nr:hypothetical protein C9925_00260 [cyanobacterium G8-9]
MKKVVLYAFFWFVFLPWAFLNYGEWIDVTEEPVKSDIIVCLGGGTVERLNTAVKLFTDGYSKENKVMLIGESYDTKEYLKSTYPSVDIEQHHEPKNTKEEVLYIKSYMSEYGYKTALVVTDPPHSRRVRILDIILSVDGVSESTLHLVSSKVDWWKAKKYYDDKRSGETVLSESIRILYTILCYGIVEKLGVLCE